MKDDKPKKEIGQIGYSTKLNFHKLEEQNKFLKSEVTTLNDTLRYQAKGLEKYKS